jgi:hypothetical protein
MCPSFPPVRNPVVRQVRSVSGFLFGLDFRQLIASARSVSTAQTKATGINPRGVPVLSKPKVPLIDLPSDPICHTRFMPCRSAYAFCFWTLRACMAGARRAGLLLMEAESICAACQQSGATAHLTKHSQTALQRLLDADEGEIALLA